VRNELSVVLLRPKEDGNVGAVARAMKNFGVARLILVAPRAPLGGEARRRAMGGLEILRRAEVVGTFDEALRGQDLVVGTSDVSSQNQNRSYPRRGLTPPEWAQMMTGLSGRIALVMGPEDNGLSREELERCDQLVSIPTERSFPSLNLSHATTVLLYEAYMARPYGRGGREAPALSASTLNGQEKEIFFDMLADFLVEINYPAHKRRGLLLLFRRVLGRAAPSDHEYSMLLGFLRRSMYPRRREKWKSATTVGSECEA
jgi:tRNA/rRNA methyltransferase